jgi:RND family efflux transporter MFP subunit
MAFLIGGVAGCAHQGETKASTNPPRVVTAETQTVKEVSVSDLYEATGTVKAALNATLSSKVAGRVESVAVREGDAIKAGQPLVFLDARELEAALDMATANYRSSVVRADSAATAAEMEERTSKAQISQAKSQVAEAKAALESAEARRDLALAGPRSQEVTQSHLAVMEANSNLNLATTELARTTNLVEEGALAQRELDLARNRFDVAKAHYDAAVQSESMTREGTRSQEIRAAQEGVSQAKATLEQAQAGVAQAQAAAMQSLVRRKDVAVAQANVGAAAAAVAAAQVALSYAQIAAPFDGRVVKRSVDPGSMAGAGVPLLAIEGGEYRLEAIVPEGVFTSVTIGNSVPVQIDALGETRLPGKVVEIVPQGDATTHSFVVKLALPSNPHIRAGMFGRASFTTGLTKRILIPESATWVREGLHYVYVLDKGGFASLRIISLGGAFEGKREVLSGLNAGETIVASRPVDVADGFKVEAAKP